VRTFSLFTGAGGMDLAFHDHETVAMCEIDPTARRVLRRHWPDIPIHEDVTDVDPRPLRGRVDLVHGGSPCQDLSVAGRRRGLDGARSGLFWHQCRIADGVASPWFVWENVAGALSSNKGQDFAAVLWGITGMCPRVPDGGWRKTGVVVGPKRWAVWRLLDAQWFGVAQRRRRVFVVGCAGRRPRPEVLLEPESLCGDPPPSREAGQSARALTATGVGTCGADDNQAQAKHLIPAVAFHAAQDPISGHVSPALSGNAYTGLAIPIDLRNATRNTGTGAGTQGSGVGEDGDPAGTVTAHSLARPAVATELGVRRLTPLECERLQGWPDDHTRWGDDGREIADTHRYRMIGNGVATPVAEWIVDRLEVES
jgi:DNA (cytosine-5)-methyltransferase 1